MLYSYKRAQALGHGLLPSNGAEIWVAPFSALKQTGTGTKVNAGVNTMDQWIQRELTTDHSNVRRTPVAASKEADAPHDIVKVEADFKNDPEDAELQHEINYYFTLNGRMFRLRLVYWKDTKNAKALQSTLESVLRRMRFTG